MRSVKRAPNGTLVPNGTPVPYRTLVPNGTPVPYRTLVRYGTFAVRGDSPWMLERTSRKQAGGLQASFQTDT